MNASLFWAVVALLMLAGWTTTLVFLMKALLPMANALSTLHKLDSFIDERIQKIVERIQAKRSPSLPKPQSRQPSVPQGPEGDELRRIFGGLPMEPIDEQPDGLEIVEG